MGCDIHLHTEVKLNGCWEHYGCPDIPRTYGLFAKMAGVRNHNETIPIAPLRGLPADATAVTRFDAEKWVDAAHSTSWLNAVEICELNVWLEEKLGDESWRLELDFWGYLFGNGWHDFRRFPDDRPAGLDDIRFVFWFDN